MSPPVTGEPPRSFTLTAPPAGFVDDPYPTYAALRRDSPVHPIAPGAWLLTRHADVVVRRLLMGALNQRAIARMEAGLVEQALHQRD